MMEVLFSFNSFDFYASSFELVYLFDSAVLQPICLTNISLTNYLTNISFMIFRSWSIGVLIVTVTLSTTFDEVPRLFNLSQIHP